MTGKDIDITVVIYKNGKRLSIQMKKELVLKRDRVGQNKTPTFVS
jgi:hypothetical protein